VGYRKNASVDRIACPWLIKRFIDPDAEFLYVPAAEVKAVASARGRSPTTSAASSSGTSTAAAASSRSSSKVRPPGTPPWIAWRRSSTAADVTADADVTPQAAGLKAIPTASPWFTATTIHLKIELETPLV